MLLKEVIGHAELLLLHLVGVGDHAAQEDVARPGHIGQPRADQPPRARLRRGQGPAPLPTEVEDDLLDRPFVVAGEEVSGERVDQGIRQPCRDGLAARPHHEVDVDLEIARADGRLKALLLSPVLVEDARDGGLRGPEEAQRAARRCVRPPDERLHSRMCEGVRPESLELGRRAGKGDRQTASVELEENRRRGPGEPERDAAFRERRLLADSGQEVPEGSLEAFGDTARKRLDLGRELLVAAERTSGGGRQELGGTVVVGRAQPA